MDCRRRKTESSLNFIFNTGKTVDIKVVFVYYINQFFPSKKPDFKIYGT